MKTYFLSGTCLIMMMLLAGSGCTTRMMYDSLRYRQSLECQEMQGSARDDCMRRSDMSYDEYQRELKKQPNR